MYATRRFPARIGGPFADDGAPFYHDACWLVDANGFALPDAEGRPVVWLGHGLCGYRGVLCAKCGDEVRFER